MHTDTDDRFTYDALRAAQAGADASRRAELTKKILGWVLLACFSVAGWLLTASFFEKKKDDAYGLEKDLATRREVAALQHELSDARAEIEKQRMQLERLATDRSIPNTNTGSGGGTLTREERQALDQVISGQAQLSTRLSALENALANTPEKALALPLLKQQLTNTQDRIHEDMDEVHSEFGRLFTMVQWALGLTMTVILALATFVIRKPEERASPKPAEKEPSI